MSVGDTLRALRAVLDRQQARWYVFGAQAVMVHGVVWTTQDIDVTVLVRRTEAGRLAGALVAAGFDHRFPDRADALIALSAVIPMRHRATGIDVDLVLGTSGLEELAESAAERRAWDGVTVPVASATHLAVMEVVAGRAKDLDDVRGLLAGGAVDTPAVEALLVQLQEALGQSDLLPTFRALRRP